MTITVEQEHIDKGEKMNSSRCAVALAIEAATGVTPEVDYAEVTMQYEDHAVRCHLPEAASLFVDEFDKGLPVEPFSFDLDMGDEDE